MSPVLLSYASHFLVDKRWCCVTRDILNIGTNAQLQAAEQLQLFTSPTWIDVHNGQIDLSGQMPRQAVAHFRLSW
jgi:hypothetical protein